MNDQGLRISVPPNGIAKNAFLLLASGRLGYMTGHPLVVDGGMSAL